MQPPNKYILLAIAWFILCTFLLTLPGTAFPQQDWLDKIWFDKWVHIGLFSILVFLFCTGVYKRKKRAKQNRRHFITWAVTGLVYGIVMEFVQKYYIPYRSFDAGDIVADAVGCFIGFAFSYNRYIKK